MTREDRDRIDNLDQQWDRYLDDPSGSAGSDGDLDRIAKLHRRDDARGPSDEFRNRLDAELLSIHPAGSTRMPAARESEDDGASIEDTPQPALSTQQRGPVSISRPGNLRDWGELAAMLVILVLAILGASLYGDDAYDFAQRQFASDEEEPDVAEQRAMLEEEGEVDGLTFEKAQELTPFEIATPGDLPDGLSPGEHAVTVNTYERRIGHRQWSLWRSVTSFETPDESLEPVTLTARPTMEQPFFPVPRETDGVGEEAPAGHLDVTQISGTGVVRSVNFSEEGDVTTSYLWKQGDVDMVVEAPFGVDMTDEQQEWVETPDAPFGDDDVERMIASLIDLGPLAVDDEQVPQRGLTLAQARVWLPTAPFPDAIPDQFELHGSSISVNLDGPSMFYRDTLNDAVGDIWVRAIAGYHHPQLRKRIHDAGGETFDHNGVAVSRSVLTEPTAPEVSDYLVSLGRFGDLLLPWMEDGAEHALATYIWDIAGMAFMMGVEIPREYVGTDADGNVVLTGEAPQADWLGLVDAKRRTAEEHLRPEQHFSVLEREPTPEDELPLDSDWVGRYGDPDQARLLTETETFRYYMLVNDNRGVCVYQVHVERGQLGGGGCSSLWNAAETGVVFSSGGSDVPTARVVILPDGYEEVVDENGELVAEVENNVFVIEVDGEPRPSELTARGPAGELSVGSP